MPLTIVALLLVFLVNGVSIVLPRHTPTSDNVVGTAQAPAYAAEARANRPAVRLLQLQVTSRGNA